MMKKSITKLLIMLLLLFTFLAFNFNCCEVQATSIENEVDSLDKIFNTEEKIMMYDSKTDETTEVDMKELRQEVVTLMKSDGTISLKSSKPSDNVYNSKILSAISPKASFAPVTDMDSFNAKTTCKIISDQGDGSASIVGNNVALTAAHCIWNEKTKAKHTNLKFYPAYSNGTSYKGLSCGWSRVYYSSEWMNNSNPTADYDWAICVLEQPLGASCGYQGANSYTLAQAMGMISKLATLYGYPSAYSNGQQQYTMGIYLMSCNNTVFTYNGAGSPGFSGGPLLYRDTGNIIAVHSVATNNESAGCRITSNMISIIKDLRG